MTTTQALRQLNEQRALAALFRQGAMSRAELARSLSLTRSATGNVVLSLIDAGLLRERPEEAVEAGARVGRPGITVEIDGNGGIFLGGYIGVDRITVVALDIAGVVRHRIVQPFEGEGCDPAAAAAAAARLIRGVMSALSPGAPVQGLCLALPGYLAADARTYHAETLGWHGVEFGSLIEAELQAGLPVTLENDANAFAVAETYRHMRRDVEDIVVVLVEAGVGAGIISGGRLYRGRLRGAGEIGHILVGEEGYVFDPRHPGRLETYIGKVALLARHRFHGGRSRDLDDFVGLLGAGDPAALRTAGDWARWLARGLAILANIVQPQVIVLGGSVAAVYPFVAHEVAARLADALLDGYPVPTVEISGTDTLGPALGAAYLLHQAMFALDDLSATLDRRKA